MKNVFVDVDSSGHSDRIEWGSALYHTHYHPQAAFELELQWLVATGCVLGDLVSVTTVELLSVFHKQKSA